MQISKNFVVDPSRKDTAQIIGKTFGKLTALSVAGFHQETRGTRTAYLFQCECGNQYINIFKDIKNGHTLSCGCLRKEVTAKTGKNNKTKYPTVEPTFIRFYKQSKSQAKARKYEFLLSESEFRVITSSNCHYCGLPPSTSYSRGHVIPYIYNGIDRKNNDLGYTLENSLPCCTTCNFAKKQNTYDYFIEWAKRIGAYQLNTN